MNSIHASLLLKQLKDSITPAERAALEDGDGLVVSRYNRATLLRMLALGDPEDAGEVDPASIEAMRAALRDYLDQYMPDRPEGHKWIILSCVFLAFVVREPLHPRQIVRWERKRGRYACPAREATGAGLCRWCVCTGGNEA